jgi:hypothetical protein
MEDTERKEQLRVILGLLKKGEPIPPELARNFKDE